MKVQNRIASVMISIFALTLAANADDQKQNFRGYILDKKCADSVKDDNDPSAFIEHHTKDCALMRNCKKSGYRLYSKGNWFDLDKKGNELAIKTLEQSKRKNNFYVEVTGKSEGKSLQVISMKELDKEKAE